jgi:hypothetical protein
MAALSPLGRLKSVSALSSGLPIPEIPAQVEWDTASVRPLSHFALRRVFGQSELRARPNRSGQNSAVESGVTSSRSTRRHGPDILAGSGEHVILFRDEKVPSGDSQ